MAKTISFDLKLTVNGKEQVVGVTTDVRAMAREFANAQKSAQSFATKMANFANFTMGLTNVQNALSSISGAMNSLTAESRSFAGAMRQANTMAGEGAAGFELMKEQVTELSKHIPIARDELARGLYQVISNGVPKDNWISYLEASAKSAVGGIANLEEVVKVTSTIIKNYGMTWDQAMTVQDKIQLTAKNGVTSFEQLAAALPSVTGQAAQLGVSLDEMLAVMSTLTGVTGNTSEVSTQLASVLTALTKESSKSQKMAAAMGIEFNAASVKAAGGLQNYLKELDKTVTAYSKKTGVLRESIYSKLFGRAEALRLVNGLTGEMAAKFDENIAAMKDSLGTMDGAFNEMASTGASKMQQLQNEMSNVRDSLTQFFGTSVVYAEFASQFSMLALSAGMALLSVKKLITGLASLSIVQAATTRVMRYLAAAVLSFSIECRAAGVAVTTLKWTLRGLASATIIGLALTALSIAAEKLGEYFYESANDIDEGTARIKRDMEGLTSSTQTYTQAAASEYGRLMGTYNKLRAEWKSLSTEQQKNAWLKKNSSLFADLSLQVDNVTDAEATFGGNTDAVVQYFERRARAAARLAVLTEEYRRQLELTDKIAANDAAAAARHHVNVNDIVNKPAHDATSGDEYLDNDGKWRYTAQGAAKANAVRWVANDVETQALRKQLQASIEKTKKLQAEIASDASSSVKLHVTRSGAKAVATTDDAEEDGSQTDKKDKKGREKDKTETGKAAKTLIAEPKTYGDLQNNVEYWKEQLDKAPLGQDEVSRKRVEELLRQKKAAEDAVAAYEQYAAAVNVPLNPASLEEFEAKLQYLEQEKRKASADTIGGILQEIKAVEQERDAFELAAQEKAANKDPQTLKDYETALDVLSRKRANASKEQLAAIDAEERRLKRGKAELEYYDLTLIDPSDVKTQEQANRLLAYYDELLRTATEGERENLMRHRADVEKVVTEWNKANEKIRRAANMPKDPRSVGDLDTAISYKREEQQEQTGDEWLKTQREINALEGRKAAIERGGDLLTTQRELEELQKLSKKELRVKIQEEGFAGLTSKIQELRRILSDPINPPTKGQRELIEGQIALYEKWRRQAVMSFDTVRSAWDSTKGLGDGVRDLTSALEGNSDAWSTITGVIDSAIKIYDSITAVIDIVKQIVAALTGSKAVEAAGTQAAADVTTEAAIQNAASAAIETVAAKTATSAYMGLAAAKTYAAHAYIPFAGVGIASNMIGVMQGVVAAASIPKFAEGGVVYGPTLALTGEYAGAANNPEIIAPLDKLRDMIQPQGIMAGRVRFEIDGRKLVGVLSNETRVAAKSGRRTNIIG